MNCTSNWSAQATNHVNCRIRHKKTTKPLMHFSIWPVTISPGQPPKQDQRFQHRGGELFEAVLSHGTCHFFALLVRWLQTAGLRMFKGKHRNLSESGWRGITYQHLSLYWKVCFKISNEFANDAYSNRFFFFFAKEKKKALIIRQLKWLCMKTTRILILYG